ncbi:sodium-dependent nutrient amino acid transporter 1-like isoform X2 [Colletes gigas]|uniref:sodium-dependent nutrient amino acid transporter 1-like isoform X2 n=1 Tax=Colletes gigas TaxID=935657 RepID=UPI001C9B84A1|nr:sodium-dependent nutrient amino acid transporter 1-like isoform X2 [Colletes gigas]
MRKYTSNGVQNGHRNAAFVADEEDQNGFRKDSGDSIARYSVTSEETEAKRGWNNSIEFLMSCIAMSIGFGNIWRFPFTAYENGGGVFLIPYIIVLFLIGKPFYYLEMIIGQFSSSTSIKVWSLSPAFVGVGWAQLCSNVALMTYYSSLMALTLFFLIASFSSELPWAKCREEWGDHCVDSSTKANISANSMGAFEGARSEGANVFDLLVTDEQFKSSAELYFLKVVLQEKDSIDDGIGLPDWKLTLCLLGSWLSVILITFQGVKSSGKASYFLAIFPYIVLVSLLIRAVTLDGAGNGILYFITPKWSKLSDLTVWYAAVTQCFFSLSVCFGTIITYSSHNDFKHNIYRDAMIVTSLDTVTSMIAGCTIFGILGNLAHEMGITDIDKVVRSGAGLAFVSYPDAIAKFDVVPQGGQFLLTLVDYYGTSFVVFILASFEITAVVWLYGIENFIDDIEFMLEKKTSIYWNVCWFLVTPLILIIIFIYTVATLSPVTYGGKDYPASAHVAGVIILCIGVFQIPFWMVAEMVKNRRLPFLQNIKASFQPTSEWGPRKTKYKDAWLLFKEQKTKERSLRTQPRWLQLICILLRVKMK